MAKCLWKKYWKKITLISELKAQAAVGIPKDKASKKHWFFCKFCHKNLLFNLFQPKLSEKIYTQIYMHLDFVCFNHLLLGNRSVIHFYVILR